MLEHGFDEPLGDSSWTVSEARSMVPKLAEVSSEVADQQASEHFLALCAYLDQLLGGNGFDRLPPATQRAEICDQIARLRTTHPTGSVAAVDDNDEDDLDDADLTDVDIDTVVRLDQPVNSSLTLAEGRDLAIRLTDSDDWRVDLGRAITAIYDLLDDLYGGPGHFTELLSTAERADVAAHLSAGDR